MKKTIILFILLLCSLSARPLNFNWSVKCDNYRAMCRDGSDNIYTTGQIPLIKYNSSGVELFRIDIKKSSGNFYGTSITTDNKGYVYLAGSFDNTISIGNFYVTTRGATDGCVMKIDQSGNIMWLKTCGDTGYESISTISTDKNGNLFIAGSYQASIIIDGNKLTGNGGSNVFLAEYNPSGSLVWAQKAEGKGSDDFITVKSVTIGNNGNCYVAGTIYGTASFYSTIIKTDLFGGFVACYNSPASVAWVKQYANATINRIKTDKQDNLYLTGGFAGHTEFDSITLNTPAGGIFVQNIFIAKLNSGGTARWASRAGSTYVDYGNSLAVDSAGNSYITGGFSEKADFGNSSLQSAGEEDIFIAKYDQNGNKLWVTGAGDEGEDGGNDICLNKAENIVYVIGNVQYGQVKFGSVALNYMGEYNFMTAISDINTGINDKISLPGLSIYPNPSKGTIQVSIGEIMEKGSTVKIINLSGQVVGIKTLDQTGTGITMDHIPTGFYIVSIVSGNRQYTRKLIVE
jgi:hypothetical protein